MCHALPFGTHPRFPPSAQYILVGKHQRLLFFFFFFCLLPLVHVSYPSFCAYPFGIIQPSRRGCETVAVLQASALSTFAQPLAAGEGFSRPTDLRSNSCCWLKLCSFGWLVSWDRLLIQSTGNWQAGHPFI